MQKFRFSFFTIITGLLLFQGCGAEQSRQDNELQAVKTGAEVLLDRHMNELEGKKIGLVMNPTSRVEGTHMLDTLLSRGVQITALFAAEHGFRGEAGAGEVIEGGIDQQTGLPVYSLYGADKKPTSSMLEEVDLILFDLPDVGSRFYTYSSTMGYVLEAAAANDVEMWILDRPNPLGGEYVSGWILQDTYTSFVGKYPIPINYGLTMGELAGMAVGEGWLTLNGDPLLRVIRTEGWQRDMKWPETGLEWIPPSPNLPTFVHTFAYPGTVIFEGTNISEGRGTPDPFLTIGAPHLKFWASELKEIEQKHQVRLDSVSFTPESIPGKSANPKFEGELCRGFRISFPNGYEQVNPVELGLDLLQFAKAHSEEFEISDFANKLYGIDIQSLIESGESLPSWEKDVARFREQRASYLLYP